MEETAGDGALTVTNESPDSDGVSEKDVWLGVVTFGAVTLRRTVPL